MPKPSRRPLVRAVLLAVATTFALAPALSGSAEGPQATDDTSGDSGPALPATAAAAALTMAGLACLGGATALHRRRREDPL